MFFIREKEEEYVKQEYERLFRNLSFSLDIYRGDITYCRYILKEMLGKFYSLHVRLLDRQIVSGTYYRFYRRQSISLYKNLIGDDKWLKEYLK